MWENITKNYRKIKSSDYIVLVALWEPDFDLQCQHKKWGMVTYSKSVSFEGTKGGRSLSCLAYLVNLRSYWKDLSSKNKAVCLLKRKFVLSEQSSHCGGSIEAGLRLPTPVGPENTAGTTFPTPAFPENSAGTSRPAPVTREHSRDQTSHSTDQKT